jgi:hypothetical protein
LKDIQNELKEVKYFLLFFLIIQSKRTVPLLIAEFESAGQVLPLKIQSAPPFLPIAPTMSFYYKFKPYPTKPPITAPSRKRKVISSEDFVLSPTPSPKKSKTTANATSVSDHTHVPAINIVRRVLADRENFNVPATENETRSAFIQLAEYARDLETQKSVVNSGPVVALPAPIVATATTATAAVTTVANTISTTAVTAVTATSGVISKAKAEAEINSAAEKLKRACVSQIMKQMVVSDKKPTCTVNLSVM